MVNPRAGREADLVLTAAPADSRHLRQRFPRTFDRKAYTSDGSRKGRAGGRVDDDGLHILDSDGRPRVVRVDSVVVCAGQESVRDLVDELSDQPGGGVGGRVHVIGGADVAAELDAERAIRQGVELAARL